MHFVLFVGTVPPEKSTESELYYRQLHPILHQQVTGLVDETAFINPGYPGTQMLFARFADEDAITQWRNNPTHLKIMHHARQSVFGGGFRITVCTDIPRPGTTGDNTERVLLVHERQYTTSPVPEGIRPDLKAGSTSEELADSEFYIGEKLSLRIWRLHAGTNVEEFEESLKILPTDVVYRLQVIRDYSNRDRTEAPSGIDDAEIAAANSVGEGQ